MGWGPGQAQPSFRRNVVPVALHATALGQFQIVKARACSMWIMTVRAVHLLLINWMVVGLTELGSNSLVAALAVFFGVLSDLSLRRRGRVTRQAGDFVPMVAPSLEMSHRLLVAG